MYVFTVRKFKANFILLGYIQKIYNLLVIKWKGYEEVSLKMQSLVGHSCFSSVKLVLDCTNKENYRKLASQGTRNPPPLVQHRSQDCKGRLNKQIIRKVKFNPLLLLAFLLRAII
jgi:hypothetical protein